MGSARLLLGLLVLALVSIDVAVGLTVRSGGQAVLGWPTAPVVALYCLAFAQTGLAAIWLGLGSAPLPWRFLTLVVITVAWSLMMGNRDEATSWNLALLAQSLGIVGVLALVRFDGWRFDFPAGGEPAGSDRLRQPPLQFSIGYLLSWTTSVALILGMAQYSFAYDDFPRKFRVWWDIGWLAVGQTAMVLGVLWALFGFHGPWVRVGLLAAGTIVCLGILELVSPGPAAANVALCLLQLGGLLVALAVVRLAGFRFRKTEALQRC